MRLVIATRNKHKVEEIRSILGNGHEYLSLADFPDAPEVHEDADSFEGNARKKAEAIARWYVGAHGGAPATILADDSGLEVDALDGAPGVISARYAGNHGDAAANNRKLLRMLKDVPLGKRTARFRCVIAICRVGLRTAAVVASGACEGRIIDAPRGTHGFGYDPLFVPDGYKQTFAELGADVKDTISHRARALEKAKQILVGAHGGAPDKE